MKIPRAPDLQSPLRLALTALLVTLIMAAILSHLYWNDVGITLGDTDDATRLVLVRQLLDGQGWWDQHLMRFQPPVGVYMHWSRLLDGVIAVFDKTLQLVFSADDAEYITRFVWPLLWIFPSSLAALLVARRLGAGLMGGAVVLVCAIILATDVQLYMGQFHPGRIDHHDVQVSLCLLALAGAVQAYPNVGGAILCGVATGLGVAIGLEALLFEAIIGAGVALRFALAPREARAAMAYGAALGATSLIAFAIQTPPWRWGVMACDAVAINLAAALAAASVGLILAAALTARRSIAVRFAALALVGAVAGAVYLGLYPNCRHGFFADVDPRIRPIWLNFVTEVMPIKRVWKIDHAQAMQLIAPWAMGALAWFGLGFRRARRSDPAWWLTGACMLVSIPIGASAARMSVYGGWFAVPLVATAALEIARRYQAGGIVVVAMVAAVASPFAVAGAAARLDTMIEHKPAKPVKAGKKAPPQKDHCSDTDSYDELADASPPGLVLSEIDLGPFIVAHTDDDALQAPYHRMSWGILKAYSLFAQPADGAAEQAVRQAGVAYVLECRFHHRHGDRDHLSKDSLLKRLDAGKPPAWLLPLSPKDAPLQAYRVAPPTPSPTASPVTSPAAPPVAPKAPPPSAIAPHPVGRR